MIFPLTRAGQDQMALQLANWVKTDYPPVVHLVRFPQLTINHAVLLFDAQQTDGETEYSAYDPNSPEEPVILKYDQKTRTFMYPRTAYFRGGRVDVYQVYHTWNY